MAGDCQDVSLRDLSFCHIFGSNWDEVVEGVIFGVVRQQVLRVDNVGTEKKQLGGQVGG